MACFVLICFCSSGSPCIILGVYFLGRVAGSFEYHSSYFFGPDYMEAGYPGRRAGSFAEILRMLILYAKNCLGKRAHKVECAYVIFE